MQALYITSRRLRTKSGFLISYKEVYFVDVVTTNYDAQECLLILVNICYCAHSLAERQLL